MVAGREFHSFGAQIENALSPYVAVLLLGVTRRHIITIALQNNKR